MKEEITTLKPEEFEDMMRFLEKCYRHSRNYFPWRYPHVWRKDTIEYENRIILKVNGKIVSHVGIFPLEMIVGKARIKMGGIGGVATLQEYRGRGYMTKLMNYAISKMKEMGFSISVLWGDRQRYGHFGYENAGKMAVLTVSLRSLSIEFSPKKVNFYRFYGEVEKLNKIITLHEREPIRVKRDKKTYELIFNIDKLITYLTDEAYITYWGEHPKSLIEVGGTSTELANLLYSFLSSFNKEFGINSIELCLPYYNYETFHLMRKVCASYHIISEGMIKILDLEKLFLEYKPYLEEVSENLALNFSLKNLSNDQLVHIVLENGSVTIERNRKGKLHIELNERDLVKLIFNGLHEVPLPPRYSQLGAIFPLPFHIWPLDHI